MTIAHTNGSAPPAETTAGMTISALRAQPERSFLVRGFGPLVAGVVLFVLMLLLAPSVAPEHVVERPAPPGTASTTTTTVAP